MSLDDDVAALTARLIAHRFLPRDDAKARRALLDELFREELDRRLDAVGLSLREHPYTPWIGVALTRKSERAVFGNEHSWLSNTLGLDRDAVALLVVLWALIILPKRQRQLERQSADAASQAQMFLETRPIPVTSDVAPTVAERTLIADFGDRLGGKTRINLNLGQLARHGFVVKNRGGDIAEGPLLDLVFDYERTARRILDGALADLLAPHARETHDDAETMIAPAAAPAAHDADTDEATADV